MTATPQTCEVVYYAGRVTYQNEPLKLNVSFEIKKKGKINSSNVKRDCSTLFDGLSFVSIISVPQSGTVISIEKNEEDEYYLYLNINPSNHEWKHNLLRLIKFSDVIGYDQLTWNSEQVKCPAFEKNKEEERIKKKIAAYRQKHFLRIAGVLGLSTALTLLTIYWDKAKFRKVLKEANYINSKMEIVSKNLMKEHKQKEKIKKQKNSSHRERNNWTSTCEINIRRQQIRTMPSFVSASFDVCRCRSNCCHFWCSGAIIFPQEKQRIGNSIIFVVADGALFQFAKCY